jgi:hypothetical protein
MLWRQEKPGTEDLEAATMPAVRLELSKNVVAPGDEITHTIVNDGEAALLFGVDYGIEERTADGWRPLNIQMAFAAVGLSVSPGQSSNPIGTRIPGGLRPGEYRLTKNLRVLDSHGAPMPKAVGEIWIRSEFVVEVHLSPVANRAP